MGKMNNEALITQEQEWSKQWEFRRLELIKEYPTYDSEGINVLLEEEQAEAIHEWEQECAMESADDWVTHYKENPNDE
jgi:hypothetical protein